MTGRMARYVGGIFLGRTVGAALALAALMQVLDLLDAATEVMDRGKGVAGIGYYALLRLPVILEQTFPLAVLVGALLTFAGLARHNEIVIMRAAGLSVTRLTGMLLLPVLAIAGLHLAIADQVVPRVERRLAIWWEKPPGDTDGTGKATWLRVGEDLVSIDRIMAAGTRLEGVRIYRRGPDDQLVQRTYAATAVRQDRVWRLYSASDAVAGPDGIAVARTTDRIWDVRLTPSNLIEAMMPFAHISTATARSGLAGTRAGARQPAYYAMRLQRAFAEPLAVVAMLLLATPAATASRRAGQAGQRLLLGLALGMLFLLADGMLAALGEAGRIVPEVAAWGALAVFGCLGIAILIHLDS